MQACQGQNSQASPKEQAVLSAGPRASLNLTHSLTPAAKSQTLGPRFTHWGVAPRRRRERHVPPLVPRPQHADQSLLAGKAHSGILESKQGRSHQCQRQLAHHTLSFRSIVQLEYTVPRQGPPRSVASTATHPERDGGDQQSSAGFTGEPGPLPLWVHRAQPTTSAAPSFPSNKALKPMNKPGSHLTAPE